MNLYQQKSDKLKFILIKLDDTWYVPRYDDIRMHSGKEENETGGRTVMIWSMFCQETLGFIIHVLSAYLNMLVDKVILFISAFVCDDGSIFQQDTMSWHTAQVLHEWFQENEGNLIVQPWPSCLNSIEYLRDTLGQQFHSSET